MRNRKRRVSARKETLYIHDKNSKEDMKKVYPAEWVSRHPYMQSDETDRYYAGLASQIGEMLCSKEIPASRPCSAGGRNARGRMVRRHHFGNRHLESLHHGVQAALRGVPPVLPHRERLPARGSERRGHTLPAMARVADHIAGRNGLQPGKSGHRVRRIPHL